MRASAGRLPIGNDWRVSHTDVERGGLGEFAKAHALAPADTSKLPTDGGLLGENDLRAGAAVTGTLPGGEPGTLCHLTYTYRSDDTTHTVERTAAVMRVAESIGFAPYLASAGARGIALGVKVRQLDGGAKVRVAEGVNDAWLAELFSPAFSEWLARSPDDFDWELANGVLCASRRGHLTTEADLARLCSDAAHIATTVREECLEEVDTGDARRSAAKTPKAKRQDVLVNSILARTTFDHPPADVSSSRPQFRHVVTSHPATYLSALFRTLLWMIAVNVIGGGIYGLLLNLPNPGQAVLIYQAFLFVVIGFFVLRSQINGTSEKLAAEGFWQQYARERSLTSEDPSTFAATHAKANLPGTPKRVLTGVFAGVPASLIVTGDGLKRGDSIALVGGETGPTATADLDFSAPGASAAALDAYAEQLAGELRAGAAAPTT